jgi:hypothetical protein
VVRQVLVGVAERLEEAARHAHAGHRDPASQLQGPDHGDQAAQECGLLGH